MKPQINSQKINSDGDTTDVEDDGESFSEYEPEPYWDYFDLDVNFPAQTGMTTITTTKIFLMFLMTMKTRTKLYTRRRFVTANTKFFLKNVF